LTLLLHETPQWWIDAMRSGLGPLPKNYIVIDTEASGVDVNTDYVLQLGVLPVFNSLATIPAAVYLDWVGAGLVNGDDLRRRMDQTRARMAERGEVYRMDYDQIRREGADPHDVMSMLAGLLQDAIRNGWHVVGQNYPGYDAQILQRHLNQFGHPGPHAFAEGRIMDTGMFEKARQLGLAPEDTESALDFALRVSHRHARVKWKLGGHCAETYGLFKRANLTPDALHAIQGDCVLTHHLFEAERELLEGI